LESDDPVLLDARRKLAESIFHCLLEEFGIPKWHLPMPPLDELVSTILSQNTNDRNRDTAFNNLLMQFPTWEAVRDASPEDVTNAIRSAGLAGQKGPRIQAILRAITKEHKNLDLDFLRELPLEEAREWLLRFKGVGPKTVAIVLCFSLGKPAFPVDTHIYRVTGRLGLRDPNMSVEKAHRYLEAIFQPEMYHSAHLNLIHLGREFCHPRNPECSTCPLNTLCRAYQSSSIN
jgi:endonuclease-3